MRRVLPAVMVFLLGSASICRADGFGHHRRQNKNLEFTIDYLDPWGHTIADSSGLHYYHDRLSQQWGISPTWVTNEATILPSRFWGLYPLYYAGNTMNYTLTLRNTGHKKYKNIDIRVFQEYLNTDGSFGSVRIGPDAVRDFRVAQLRGGETITFNGSIAIPGTDVHSGLDQTDIIVYKQRKGSDDEEDDADEAPWRDHRHDVDGKIIFWEPQAGIWCPPPAKPNKP